MKRMLISLASLALALPGTVFAGPAASIEGRVLTPASGAAAQTVWAASPATPDSPQRAVVEGDGTFRLDGIPAGRVELAVETAEGMYLVESPLTLAPGATRQVQLALRGRQDTSAPPADSDNKKKKSGGMWANPLTATTIVVGAAVLTGVIIDQTDDDQPSAPASASTPLD